MTITLLLPDAHWNKKARENTITQLKQTLTKHPQLQTKINALIQKINEIQDIENINEINKEIQKINMTLEQDVERIETAQTHINTPPTKRGLFYKITNTALALYLTAIATFTGTQIINPPKATAESQLYIQQGNVLTNRQTGENYIIGSGGEIRTLEGIGIGTTNQGTAYTNPPIQPGHTRNDNPQYKQQDEETQTIDGRVTAEDYKNAAISSYQRNEPPEKRLKILKEGVKKYKDNAYLHSSLSGLYCTLGEEHEKKGRLNEARNDYQESRKHLLEVKRIDPNYDSFIDWSITQLTKRIQGQK